MEIVPEKRKILALAISIGILALYFIGNYYFGNHFISYLWIFDVVLFSILSIGIMAITGFFVLNALFFVAAELSLLIFLAQSYCAIPQRTLQADQALKSLIFAGLIYITGKFVFEFRNKTKEKYKVLEKEKWSKEKIFLWFALSFLPSLLFGKYALLCFP